MVEVSARRLQRYQYCGSPTDKDNRLVEALRGALESWTLDIFCATHPKGDCMQFMFERPLFVARTWQVLRGFLFGWHMHRYLRIPFLDGRRYQFFLGKELEIWRLLEKDPDVKMVAPDNRCLGRT